MKYAITYIKKLDVNKFTDEMPVGEIEADLLGVAKRTANEYLNQWFVDKKLKVCNKGEWVKDVKRNGQVRDFMVTDGDKPSKLIFILREA